MSAILEGNSSTIEGQLGWKGERGYSAYEIAVQHGYIGTEDEWLASKNEKWQDEGGVDVKFFKGDTDDLEDRPIANGQLLYNVDTGETYLDYVQDRIPMGSGNVVAVSDTEPANPATKLWINPDEPLNNIGTEVVNSMEGNQTTMAPSVATVKNNFCLQQQLPSETNIDNLLVTGIYSIFNATGTLPSGYSTTDNNIFVENFIWEGEGLSWGRQMLHDIRSNRSFTRNKQNGVWYAWYEITD